MQVRPARVEDAARIAEVHVRSWQGGYQGLMPQDYLDGLDPAVRLPARVRSLQEADWSRGGTLVVTDDQGEIAGFAHLGQSRDVDAGPGLGELFAIYLAPPAWGQGMGRALMEAALAKLAELGYTQATLWVLDANARARRFYEAAGFRPDGAIKVDDSPGFPMREIRYRRLLP